MQARSSARAVEVPPNPGLQARAEAVPEGNFLGGPRRDFERVGRHMFRLLRNEGLEPHHRLLDVGCGALRAGYWFIHYLDAGNYYGIEPNKKRLRVGRRFILEPGIKREKQPHFSRDDSFDFSVFGEDIRFDFVVARSVWTHASKAQIATMLDSFRATAAPGATFLTSYLPARPVGFASGATGRKTLLMRDYQGDGWIGTSHKRKRAGLVAHSTRWIAAACEERGLGVETIKGEVVNRQRWLRITARRRPPIRA